ncbi:MAG: hypothetical protein K2Z81_25885, partial [Cyanobacteria bacterium]|nr:hypothetical protein [Cyanobacteriota bacterium]
GGDATEGEGSVLVNGVSSDSASPKHERKSVGKDGTVERDEENRVVSTESADGKMKRTFKYEDPKNPQRATTVTVNGDTYKYIAPIIYSNTGEVVKKDGLEMACWTVLDSQGKWKSNWYGAREVTAQGVYVERDDRSGGIKFEDSSGKELTKEQADKRNTDGIWPSRINIERPDGSKVEAELKGNVVQSLKESRVENGKETTVKWTRQGDRWVSDESPARERTGVSVGKNGDYSYTESDGTKRTESKNGEVLVSRNGVTDKFDRHGDRVSVETADGTRSLRYEDDGKVKRSIAEITTKSGNSETRWTRKNGTDEWVSGDKSEVRKDLKLLADGSVEFTNKAGEKVKETSSLQRIEYDASRRPRSITFPSGAERTFVYDKDGLKSFSDHIPAKDQKHDIEWKRDGTGFVSEREKGKQFRREGVTVTEDGDIRYTGEDKKPHVAKVRDLDRIARGEFVMSSESMLEARDRLSEAVKSSGINTERFTKWMKEFEDNAVKNKLAPEKVVKTFNNLSDILVSSDRSPHFDKEQKKTLVDTAMHNLARPLEIDQGSHPTCNVTSVEVYAAVKHPEQYSRLLKEIALTGKWTTSDGKKVTPPTNYQGTDPDGKTQTYNALKPGKDELKYDLNKPDSGDRNLASQVVQMTLINGMYELGHMNKVEDGKVKEDRSSTRYLMGPNRTQVEYAGGSRIETDLGEDLLLRDGKPVLGSDGRPSKGGPSMVQDNVLKSAELLCGEEPPYIECAAYYDDPQTGQRKYTNPLPTKEGLLELKRDGRMPILTPTMGGAHAQTIHDLWEDPKTGKLWILLDNQHGEPEVKGTQRKSGEGDGDGWITLDVLHNTLRMPPQGTGYGQPVMPTLHKYSHPSKPQK